MVFQQQALALQPLCHHRPDLAGPPQAGPRGPPPSREPTPRRTPTV